MQKIFILGLLIFLIAGGAYFLGKQTTTKSSSAPVVTSQTPQPTASPNPIDETASWKMYASYNNKFSFKYPPEFTIYKNHSQEDDPDQIISIMTDKPHPGAPDFPTPGTLFRILHLFKGFSNPENFLTSRSNLDRVVSRNDPTIGNSPAIKYQLEVIDIGDPQTGISFFPVGTKYSDTFIKLDDGYIYLEHIDEKNPEIYQKILSTFKFTK